MLLSDRTIRALLSSGDVKIMPEPADSQIQPISVDLTLGSSWCEESHRDGIVLPYRFISSQNVIRPGQFMLAATNERLVLPEHIAAFVHGKSTWARRGLVVECAGLVDPGFDGTITLELKNLSSHPIPLSAGQPICQVTFHAIDSAVLRPYGSAGLGSHYQGQIDAEPAR